MKSLPLVAWLALLASVAANRYCRCELNDVAEIRPVVQCANCTTDFCYDEVFHQAKNETDKLNLVCFRKESAKEATVVYSFIAIVAGLVGYGVYLSRNPGL
ncbi:hypothetical protein DIURU_000030 [Diutina rugosa]|uniref:Uncharacterized protein n=1 Tax=Diutina rugosa TaxID=5481 RepID=A0A642V1E0_DIURU|nr:uncharacterized protein DIURU_000030 [Diutina rugosa]KAA8908717.1 hypothetical protein DIURU_000030 [Diutina rugosa]